MAKDNKGKQGKKKDGKKSGPIPKHVAGIKVPKELRKAGNKAAELVKDPVVSEVVAAALLSAAAALRDGGVKPAGGQGSGGSKASPLGDSLKLLAVDLARRTLEGVGDRQRAKAARPKPVREEERG